MNTHEHPPESRPIGFRCPQQLFEDLKERAEAEHRSVSNLVIKLLSDVIESEKPGVRGKLAA
jgi:hypothetical protein